MDNQVEILNAIGNPPITDTSSEMAFVADVHAIVCDILDALADTSKPLDLAALRTDMSAIRDGAAELIQAAEEDD